MQVPFWPSLDQLFRQFRFANLMALYEDNYARLLVLAPDLETPARRARRPLERIVEGEPLAHDVWARLDGWPDLHLRCVLCHRFTTDVVMTHYFPGDWDEGDDARGLEALPNLGVRLFHDSAQAQLWPEDAQDWVQQGVLEQALGLDGHGLAANKGLSRFGGDCPVLQRRWAANLFLSRWLQFCQARGYRFAPWRGASAASLVEEGR